MSLIIDWTFQMIEKNDWKKITLTQSSLVESSCLVEWSSPGRPLRVIPSSSHPRRVTLVESSSSSQRVSWSNRQGLTHRFWEPSHLTTDAQKKVNRHSNFQALLQHSTRTTRFSLHDSTRTRLDDSARMTRWDTVDSTRTTQRSDDSTRMTRWSWLDEDDSTRWLDEDDSTRQDVSTKTTRWVTAKDTWT